MSNAMLCEHVNKNNSQKMKTEMFYSDFKGNCNNLYQISNLQHGIIK